MLIDELPGVYFKERVAYELSGEGSKIPIFIGKTGNTSTASDDVYLFTSYNNENKETVWATGTVKETGVSENGYSEVVVLTNSLETDPSFVGQKFYVVSDAKTDGSVLYPLYSDAGTTPANIYVTIVKEEYKVDGSSFLRFDRLSDALRPVVTSDVTKTEGNITATNKWNEATGIGEYIIGYDENNKPIYNEENLLAKRIYEFYQESRLLQSTDIGVPYFYVIDVGEGTDVKVWEKALETAKTLTDATVEIYVGAEDIQGCTLEGFYIKAVDSIFEDAEELDLRYGFGTLERLENESLQSYDTRLKQLSNELRSNYGSALYKLSRFGLCEELLFGKTMARICCTPYNTEPGFFVYRSVEPNTFNKRLKEDMKSLQDNGIIFNRDEQVNGNKYPRINLCVSCSFGSATDRPADSLFHARFNADDLLREVFEACFKQIKANESATNIAYLQSDINRIVNTRVANEEMVLYDDRTEAGTRLIVRESEEEPYNLIVDGQIQPVKCTIAIKVQAIIKI